MNMNKRQRHKHVSVIQKSFDIIAEHLANTNRDISFFIDPNYDYPGQNRFQLHSCNKPILVSKRLEFKEWKKRMGLA